MNCLELLYKELRMVKKLILISTHFESTALMLYRFAKRCSPLVMVFDNPKSSLNSCILRRAEVLVWIFNNIKLTLEMMENIHEINICIDFNIGHSGEDLTPMANFIHEINSHKEANLQYVKDKDAFKKAVISNFLPVKLFLMGEGSGHRGDNPLNCGEIKCEQSTSLETINKFSYMGLKALDNFKRMKRQSNLIRYARNPSKSNDMESERKPLIEKEEDTCCSSFITKNCVIL